VVRTITNHVPNSLFRKWEVSNSLAVPVTGTYDPQDAYVMSDARQYQDPQSYSSQAPLSSASTATAASGSQATTSSRDRDRDRERERDRGERHHSGRSRR
jgi:hypothetical protein